MLVWGERPKKKEKKKKLYTSLTSYHRSEGNAWTYMKKMLSRYLQELTGILSPVMLRTFCGIYTNSTHRRLPILGLHVVLTVIRHRRQIEGHLERISGAGRFSNRRWGTVHFGIAFRYRSCLACAILETLGTFLAPLR